eukprot:XP_001695160.1 predicted protein [Chlamydomonas reinhardtii]
MQPYKPDPASWPPYTPSDTRCTTSFAPRATELLTQARRGSTPPLCPAKRTIYIPRILHQLHIKQGPS